jgi:hypothetical protein
MKKVMYFAAAAVLTMSIASCGGTSESDLDRLENEMKEQAENGMDKVENQVDETVNTVKEEGEEMLDAAKDKGAEMVEEGKEAANKMQKEIKM